MQCRRIYWCSMGKGSSILMKMMLDIYTFDGEIPAVYLSHGAFVKLVYFFLCLTHTHRWVIFSGHWAISPLTVEPCFTSPTYLYSITQFVLDFHRIMLIDVTFFFVHVLCLWVMTKDFESNNYVVGSWNL